MASKWNGKISTIVFISVWFSTLFFSKWSKKSRNAKAELHSVDPFDTIPSTDLTKTKRSQVSYVISPLSFIFWLFKIFPDWERADTADVSTEVRGTDWRGKNNHSVFFLFSNFQFEIKMIIEQKPQLSSILLDTSPLCSAEVKKKLLSVSE